MADNFFGITDTGKMRTNNEDTFIAELVSGDRFIVACVIDGVGGYEGGEVAAQLARDAILNHLRNTTGGIIAQIKEALAAANEAIYQEKINTKSNEQMACVLTLALVDIANNKFYYGHVGDTRLYLLRDQSLVKVTKDHSFVGFLEDSGRLSEEAAMRHPKRNEINKALGFDAQIKAPDYIETGESPFLPGDALLLCSDGLSDMISNSEMTAIMTNDKPLAAKGKMLVALANDAGGKDNITVVLVQNDKTALQQTPTKPAPVKKNDIPEVVSTPKVATTSHALKAEGIRKKRSSIVPFVIILCILILGAIGWIAYQYYDNDKQHKRAVGSIIEVKERNEQEQKFIDSIIANTTGEVFLFNQVDNPSITITDSVIVNRDSLHIIGNGITLIADSGYKGPALTLAPNCQYLLLDSVVIENFDIGVLATNKGLHLKNVQFKNCRVPVQYQLQFKDQPVVNGRFADTVFYNSDVIQ